MELLSWFAVGFLTELNVKIFLLDLDTIFTSGLNTYLHSVGPGSFSQHQWNLNELFVCVLPFQMSDCNFPFLEMSSIALWQIEGLSQAFHTTRTVSAIPLKVGMSQTMLLLIFFDYPQN
jgi:hypothetical protein